MGENDLVPGSGDGVPQGTPNPSDKGVATQATPSAAQPVDANKLRADYESKLATYQRDLNQMKSSLQRQTAQVNAEWQSRYEELQNQMHETRMASMTAEDREKYEAQLQGEEMQNLQNQLVTLQNERQTMAQMLDGMSFFIQQGVPAEKLVLNEGYDNLVRSGWDFITGELNRLRQAPANPQPQSNEPVPLKQAPDVVTDKGTPGSGSTWAALRQQFGSEEAVYRAVEEGRLDPSIIPTG